MDSFNINVILESLSNINSHHFFNEVCLSLNKIFRADFVFIATIDESHKHATTIAVVNEGSIENNFSFTLAGTPIVDMMDKLICIHCLDIQQLYPNDPLLVDMNIKGYVGIPLKSNTGDVHAILVALFYESIDENSLSGLFLNSRLKIIDEIEALYLQFSCLIEKKLHKNSYLKTTSILENIIDNSHEAIMTCDKNKKIIFVNSSFTRMTGYTQTNIQGKTPRILSSGRQSRVFYQLMWQNINEKGCWQGKIWNKRKDGKEYLEWLSITTIYDEYNNVSYYNAFFLDITEQYKTIEKVKFQDLFDPLTKAANKKMLFEFIERSLIQHPLQLKNYTAAALLVIDIDLFKKFNSLYSHEFGDKVLINTANRLQSLVRNGDILARTSGDNFTFFVNHLSNEKAIIQIIDNITNAFLKPFVIDSISIKLTLSIGIAYFSKDALDAFGLFEKAEQAMFYAKNSSCNSYGFYSQHILDEQNKQEQFKIALELAIKNDEFSVVFQPIISVKNQSVTKFEALVRWNNNGNWVSPVEFIPMAEKFGLIKQIGDIVLNKACSELKKLQEQGFTDLVFNVNRSIYEFPLKSEDNNLWIDTIKMYGLAPKNICFELTESVIAPESDGNIALLNKLQTAGCTIALDDFGTGYSSLSYLRRFPIDTLKIDRSFIMEMTKVEGDVVLVSAIISMAKALNISVVAEGVELEIEVDMLTELGCDFIQGYYFSKPLPPESILQYLTNFNYR
ncbi:MAG: EAL domain-containing protein [Colwellia sp.]